jgi:hypothetical protein
VSIARTCEEFNREVIAKVAAGRYPSAVAAHADTLGTIEGSVARFLARTLPDLFKVGTQFPSSKFVATRQFLPANLPTGNGSYSPLQRLASQQMGQPSG